jgi:hypothetical protein
LDTGPFTSFRRLFAPSQQEFLPSQRVEIAIYENPINTRKCTAGRETDRGGLRALALSYRNTVLEWRD